MSRLGLPRKSIFKSLLEKSSRKGAEMRKERKVVIREPDVFVWYSSDTMILMRVKDDRE